MYFLISVATIGAISVVIGWEFGMPAGVICFVAGMLVLGFAG